MTDLEPVRRRRRRRPTAGELPGLARTAAAGGVRAGLWMTVTTVAAGRRAVDVALHPEHAGELAEDVRAAAGAVSRALGGDLPIAPRPEPASEPPLTPAAVVTPSDANALHVAGAELLRRSRDVWSDDRGHPAYARIIGELAPDEGRILLLLLRKGPQAAVDVRTGGLGGAVSSHLVAANLTMIGALAGCRHVERVPSYLHNLERLGLVWFSPEMLRDPAEYQVLEAQPEVVAAAGSVRRAKVVRRSINLTPFGTDFCRDGLGLHLSQEELSVAPPHARPATD